MGMALHMRTAPWWLIKVGRARGGGGGQQSSEFEPLGGSRLSLTVYKCGGHFWALEIRKKDKKVGNWAGILHHHIQGVSGDYGA